MIKKSSRYLNVLLYCECLNISDSPFAGVRKRQDLDNRVLLYRSPEGYQIDRRDARPV
jgi:hypothetical protein